jgi:hypothetical protein
MIDRIAHTGLSAKMHLLRRPGFGKDPLQRRRIFDACGQKRKFLRLREPGLLQAHIIVGVEVVQPDDLLFARQQPAA